MSVAEVQSIKKTTGTSMPTAGAVFHSGVHVVVFVFCSCAVLCMTVIWKKGSISVRKRYLLGKAGLESSCTFPVNHCLECASRWHCCPSALPHTGFSLFFLLSDFGFPIILNPLISLERWIAYGACLLLLSYECNPVFLHFLLLAVLWTYHSLSCFFSYTEGRRKVGTSE